MPRHAGPSVAEIGQKLDRAVDAVQTDTAELRDDSLFVRVADRVSYGMGTPWNIAVWLALVLAWFLLFGTGLVAPDATFMPRWFTGTAFNFPLNTVTTLAELYIGFLVGAAANRNERSAEAQSARIEVLERTIAQLVSENTTLTREIHREVIPFVKEIHERVHKPVRRSAATPKRVTQRKSS